MSTIARIWTDAELVTGLIPQGADFLALDNDTTAAINGDEGGTWAPSAPIIIGGDAGFIFASVSTIGSGGPISNSSTQPIQFGKLTEDDVFAFGINGGNPLTRTLTQTLSIALAQYDDQIASPSGNAAVWQSGARFLFPAPAYHEATIVSMSINVGVCTHASLPTAMPRFRLIAIDQFGNQLLLRAPDTTTDANGYTVIPTPASGSAWHNGGTPQTFTFTCDQNNVVDLSQYAYFFDVIEEVSTVISSTGGSFNQWNYATLAFSAPVLTGQE